MFTFVKAIRIQAPARQVFAWHERPDALEKLIPPWESAVIEQRPQDLRDGSVAIVRVAFGPLKLRWVAEHCDYQNRGDQGGTFTDVQLRGPFKSWRHRHDIRPDGADACVLEDHVIYELPGGFLGRWLGTRLTTRKLERMFDYRHRITREDNEQPG